MHVFIIGAPASGKMTIGQELSKLTDATLFFSTINQLISHSKSIKILQRKCGNLFVELTFLFLEQAPGNHRSVILTGVIDFQINTN